MAANARIRSASAGVFAAAKLSSRGRGLALSWAASFGRDGDAST